jgi:Serine/threonine protein phosphatase
MKKPGTATMIAVDDKNLAISRKETIMLAQQENDLSGITYSTVLQWPTAIPQAETTGSNTVCRSPLALHVSSATDPGIRHKYRPNEDMLAIVPGCMPLATPEATYGSFVLLVIADGMGGVGHGREASRLATRTLVEYVSDALHCQWRSADALLPLLSDGMLYANETLYLHCQQQGCAMGTTMTAALVVGQNAYIAHVGDSRLYRYRASSGLTQVTHDHSAVAALLDEGLITPSEVHTHPLRHHIFRSLGIEATVEVATTTLQLEPDDMLLLCTDGLWNMVNDSQISTILAADMDLPEIAPVLIQAALAGGGADNVSAIVARLQALSMP